MNIHGRAASSLHRSKEYASQIYPQVNKCTLPTRTRVKPESPAVAKHRSTTRWESSSRIERMPPPISRSTLGLTLMINPVPLLATVATTGEPGKSAEEV